MTKNLHWQTLTFEHDQKQYLKNILFFTTTNLDVEFDQTKIMTNIKIEYVNNCHCQVFDNIHKILSYSFGHVSFPLHLFKSIFIIGF